MNSNRKIYHAKQLPVFQNKMFSSANEAINCIKGDVELVQDIETGLIFNNSFNPDLMKYDANYQNEQANSSIFKEHLNNISDIIIKHFWSRSLIEVGCGKGYFLELLQGKGFKITGLDPAYEGNNASVIKKYFSPEIGLQADVIILRHVLEHVQDPIKFLSNICASNGNQGKIFIEVPCFEWICNHFAWYDVFYEHVNYFRLLDFYNIFGEVIESGHTFGGQYLYVIADLATINPFIKNYKNFEFPKNFLKTVDQFAQKIQSKKRCVQKLSTAIWGASSKGVIFSLFMQRAGSNIDLVIDINPVKQGKYLAATGFQISSPELAIKKLVPGADIYIMNSNYLTEIKYLTKNRFNYFLVES